jgi:hypothetical protein
MSKDIPYAPAGDFSYGWRKATSHFQTNPSKYWRLSKHTYTHELYYRNQRIPHHDARWQEDYNNSEPHRMVFYDGYIGSNPLWFDNYHDGICGYPKAVACERDSITNPAAEDEYDLTFNKAEYTSGDEDLFTIKNVPKSDILRIIDYLLFWHSGYEFDF